MFGVRLDRPDAIGDEGRPRATSLGIAAVVVVGLALATGVLLGDAQLLGGNALIAGLVASGLALLNRDRFGPKVVGHLMYLPGATALAGLLILNVATTLPWSLVAGFSAAFLGIAAGWSDVGDADTLESALGQSILSYAFTYVVMFAAAMLAAVGLFLWTLFDGFLGGANPTLALGGFLAVVGLAAACVRFAVGQLPIVQLTPVDRREERGERIALLRHRLLVTAVGGLLLGIAVAFLLDLVLVMTIGPSAAVAALRPLALLSSPFVVGPVAAVGAAGLAVGLLVVAVRKSSARLSPSAVKQTAAGVAALVYCLMLGVLAPTFVLGLGLVGPVVLAAIAIVGPVVVFVVHGFVLLFVRVDVFPERAGGPALAAAGLVVAGVGAATGGLPSALAFALVVGGAVVWDVGSFGLGVTAELGHLPETRRLELFHGVFAIGVGAVALAAALLLEALRTSVGAEIGAAPAMTIAALGVLLVLAPLRG